MIEDLRRIPRISVCCRVVVRDRYGVWTAVTDDLCVRGCQIVTPRLLRCGTLLHLTLSSDLFPEELEAPARTVWSAPDRLGVLFVESSERPGALSPEGWLEKVLEHGEMPESATTWRLVPSVQRTSMRPVTTTSARNGRLVRTTSSAPPTGAENVTRVPARGV